MDDITRECFESLRQAEKEELAKAEPLISEFTRYCASKGLKLGRSNFRYMFKIGVYAEYPNILRILSGLQAGKDSLYSECDILNTCHKHPFIYGYYYADKYMAMASPYFRRAYHGINNFAPRFVEKFWSLSNPNIDKYIALDENRVRINVNNEFYMECDTWYGAPFMKDISMIKDGVVVLVPPADISEFYDNFFGEVCKLDIVWTTHDGIKEFQAEEIKNESVTINIDGITYHPVRYIHAEYDLANSCFRHFDGAMHLYTSEEYAQRKVLDMNFNNKNVRQMKARSTKLFKLNGNISVDIWAELVCHFLTGNPFIHEYFTGKLPLHVQDVINRIRSRMRQL